MRKPLERNQSDENQQMKIFTQSEYLKKIISLGSKQKVKA